MWKEAEFWKETQANAGNEKLNKSNFKNIVENLIDKREAQNLKTSLINKSTGTKEKEEKSLWTEHVRPLTMNKRPSLGTFV